MAKHPERQIPVNKIVPFQRIVVDEDIRGKLTLEIRTIGTNELVELRDQFTRELREEGFKLRDKRPLGVMPGSATYSFLKDRPVPKPDIYELISRSLIK